MRSGSKQLLLIAGAVLLTAGLYFAPQKINKTEAASEAGENAFSFNSLLTEAKGQLKRQELDQVTLVEDALKKAPESEILTDSLGKIWDRLNMPYISAHYYEEVALKHPDEKNWISTAYRYYDSFRMTDDSTLRKMFVDKAIASYKKVLEINPENLDAKTDLGLCYAEGTSSPMQGIMMLREVVQKNPEHETAQFNLGVLSVKSGQYDKAVERFEKVLQINPKNSDARFLLGRTYATMGKKDLALQNLNQLKETGDPRYSNEVNTLINQINNH
jgi:tetratricopeptide (TPR) repeat protein